MAATLDNGTNNINSKTEILVTKEISVLGPVQRKTAKRMRKR